MKETESTLYAEVRECKACGKMWECPGNPETTALRAKIERMIADNALHCEQYNAGVEAAKTGKVCGPRPEFDTSTYYDGYAATMLPALRAQVAELEAERDKYKSALKAIGIGMLMPDEFAKAALDGRWKPLFEKGGE